jgi:hypothetical protein
VAIVAEGPRWQLCHWPLLKRQRPLGQLRNFIRRTRLETPRNNAFLGKVSSPGEVLGIIGPSGAGKSTLARQIVGVLVSSASTAPMSRPGRTSRAAAISAICRRTSSYSPTRWRRTTGVEVEGGVDIHYVRTLGASPNWLKYKWLAKARLGGDSGLAKGYCWIGIKE